MDDALLAAQKRQDAVAAFWPRKLSPHVTRLFLKTAITPNQITLLWGAISALNSYVVYRAMGGEYLLIFLIPAVYTFCYVLDCCDGEIARFRRIEDPVVGKLLDGICHRATEYSLIGAFALGAAALAGPSQVMPIALLLLTGDAMYTYVYERRLTTLRQLAGFSGRISMPKADQVYDRGAAWTGLTRRQKIGTIVGQIHYKSIYPVVALAYISSSVLLIWLVVLGIYKHYKWVQLMFSVIHAVRAQANSMTTRVAAPAVARPLSPAHAGAVQEGHVDVR